MILAPIYYHGEVIVSEDALLFFAFACACAAYLVCQWLEDLT